MSIPTGSRVPLRNTMAGRGAVHEVAHISQVSSIDSSIANESLVGLRRAIVNNCGRLQKITTFMTLPTWFRAGDARCSWIFKCGCHALDGTNVVFIPGLKSMFAGADISCLKCGATFFECTWLCCLRNNTPNIKQMLLCDGDELH